MREVGPTTKLTTKVGIFQNTMHPWQDVLELHDFVFHATPPECLKVTESIQRFENGWLLKTAEAENSAVSVAMMTSKSAFCAEWLNRAWCDRGLNSPKPCVFQGVVFSCRCILFYTKVQYIPEYVREVVAGQVEGATWSLCAQDGSRESVCGSLKFGGKRVFLVGANVVTNTAEVATSSQFEPEKSSEKYQTFTGKIGFCLIITLCTGWRKNNSSGGAPIPIYNQMDYILCSIRQRQLFTDARSYAGTLLDSDHRLLVTRMKLDRLHGVWGPIEHAKKQRVGMKIAVDRLSDPCIRKEYQSALENAITQHCSCQPETKLAPRELWDQVHTTVMEVASATLGASTRPPKGKLDTWPTADGYGSRKSENPASTD